MIRYRWAIKRMWHSVLATFRNIIKLATNLSVFVAVLLALYVVYDANMVASGTVIGDELMEYAPSDEATYDWKEWKKINPDIVAWIRMDGTSIDYPVLQSNNNDYYLSRNYRREFATAGSIFVDYRDNIINDSFAIIYGHRMSGGRMFSDVTKYADESFFDSHLSGVLYTENGIRNLEVIGFAKIASNSIIYASHEDSSLVVEYLRSNMIFWRDETRKEKYILLSTCDRNNKMVRDVLLINVL